LPSQNSILHETQVKILYVTFYTKVEKRKETNHNKNLQVRAGESTPVGSAINGRTADSLYADIKKNASPALKEKIVALEKPESEYDEDDLSLDD
jgi:hypothetical protein